MAMTKQATMTWPSLTDRQNPQIEAVRAPYIESAIQAGATDGYVNDITDTVTIRHWLDQLSAENWATFITTAATDQGITVNVVIDNIS
jgi:hypothetical protein